MVRQNVVLSLFLATKRITQSFQKWYLLRIAVKPLHTYIRSEDVNILYIYIVLKVKFSSLEFSPVLSYSWQVWVTFPSYQRESSIILLCGEEKKKKISIILIYLIDWFQNVYYHNKYKMLEGCIWLHKTSYEGDKM